MLALLLFSATAKAADQYAPIIIQELRPQSWDKWSEISGKDFVAIKDDDIKRHAIDAGYFNGIQIDERYVRENGFVWHLLRFTNGSKPDGPLWVVPHDDENAAFEAMIAAIKDYGGIGFAINTGSGSERKQSGQGTCGGRPAVLQACDPNRNFSDATPLFTDAILAEHWAGHPIIALHTNTPGFGKGKGDITILDTTAAGKGQRTARSDGYFGINGPASLNDPDVYAILPYAAPKGIPADAITCRHALNDEGVNVWHERVMVSDGSLSNYITLKRPDIAYVNMEAKREADISKAAEAQRLMIAAYVQQCHSLWK